MTTAKKYRLLKEVNFFGHIYPAGTIYVQHGGDYYWPIDKDRAHCPSGQVDFMIIQNPEYFTPVNEGVEITTMGYVQDTPNGGGQYYFCTTKQIHPDQFPSIKEAINKCINKVKYVPLNDVVKEFMVQNSEQAAATLNLYGGKKYRLGKNKRQTILTFDGINEVAVIKLNNGWENLAAKILNILNEKPTFTFEQLNDAFDQSRLTNPIVGFKHDTFKDYLNTIQ